MSETTTWYKASRYVLRNSDNGIEPVEVQKETDQCIYVKGRRSAKVSDGESYFKTRKEAVQWRRDYLQRQVDSYSRQIETAKRNLKEFNEKEKM